MNGPSGELTRLNIRRILDVVDATELFDEAIRLKLHAQATNLDDDGETFVRALAKRGLLTQYQAAALYQGKAAALRIGPFILLERLGSGGVGTVFKARAAGQKDVFAVKVLNVAAVRSSGGLQRFLREADAALRLRHPNIVRALQLGETGGRHYLVMEWVDGADLSSHVKRNGPLPLGVAVDCIVQAAHALAYAHGEGLVHRDIKPANILLTRDNQIKLLDLGLARLSDRTGGAAAQAQQSLTQTGDVLGTIDYMAPEQALQTKLADARSDIYSLGCTFYRILTGSNPYGGESVVEKILAHREQPIPSLRDKIPGVPKATDVVFRRMLSKRPEDRQQSMSEVAEDLRRSLTAPTVPEPAAPSPLPIAVPCATSLPAPPPIGNGVRPTAALAPQPEFAGYALELPPARRTSPLVMLAAAALLAAIG
ncbi:MAG: serine/threonine protein kinase, partial [Planctomycetaceae bacterium]|nr:serine/threonine protein kinase [Planctomycetaceae bacterium]